jgi:hypothetical protein
MMNSANSFLDKSNLVSCFPAPQHEERRRRPIQIGMSSGKEGERLSFYHLIAQCRHHMATNKLIRRGFANLG